MDSHFDHSKACRRLVGIRRERFDHCKSCKRLAQLWIVVLTTVKHVGGLQGYGESVLTTANHEACRDLMSVF